MIPIYSTRPSKIQHLGLNGYNTDNDNYIKNELYADDFVFDNKNELENLLIVNNIYKIFSLNV